MSLTCTACGLASVELSVPLQRHPSDMVTKPALAGYNSVLRTLLQCIPLGLLQVHLTCLCRNIHMSQEVGPLHVATYKARQQQDGHAVDI
jgi:hypothetical protein